MNSLFVGTGNKNKISEIKDILSKNNIRLEIKCPKDFNDSSDPIEDGFSFEENARIKARFFYEKYKIPCMAEDSGICIKYFNDYPGIHSKRFLSNCNDSQKNQYVLKLMNGIRNREAVFHCVICYIDRDGNEHTFEGLNYGEIALKEAGSEGFGYDPIFYIIKEGKTEAELGNDYKNVNSHRAKALKKFIEYLKNEKD